MNEESLGTINLSHEIGFSNITDLIRSRSIDKGFQINILISGRRGLGSSTLINALFGALIIPKNRNNDISITNNEIVENGISLETSIISYHNINISDAIEYINNKNMEYFENEQGPYKIYRDCRIHACIYMISDTLTDQEIRNMYELSTKVNFIPVLSKGDMYTSEELSIKKKCIHDILVNNNIRCFIPDYDQNHDSDQEDFSYTPPFCVIASESMHEINGEIVRGRKYPWGFINIENEEQNDFKRLQRMLIYKYYDDLISHTHIRYYNNFRKEVMEVERNSESVQVTRYNKLKNEMRLLLKEKIESQIRDMEEEEAMLNE